MKLSGIFSSVARMVGIVSAAAVLGAVTTSAVPVNLAAGNATATIDSASPAGMHAWTVDGTDYLTTQWFWYRVGNTAETSLDTLIFGGVAQSTPTNAVLSYNGAGFSVSISYTLSGGQAGSGVSGLVEEIQLVNLTGQTLNLSFFQYSDYSVGGETVSVSSNPLGKYYYAAVNAPTVALSETVLTPGANRAEVAPVAHTLNRLNDGVATSLDNSVGPQTGDVSFAFQWDFSILQGQSAQISKIKTIQVVPEPSVLMLAGFGAAVLLIFRRR